MDRYLNAKQVMDVLGVGRSTVYALFHREDFPTVRIGKRVLVSEAALAAWAMQGGTAAADPACPDPGRLFRDIRHDGVCRQTDRQELTAPPREG